MSAKQPERIYVGRLAGAPVFDPIGDRVGFVYDVLAVFRLKGDPLVVGLAVEVAGKRRVFLPITRVTAMVGGQVITTGVLNMRRFAQRDSETAVLRQMLDQEVHLKETGELVSIVDAGMEKVRGREWVISTLYVRPGKVRRRNTSPAVEVPVGSVEGLQDTAIARNNPSLLALLSTMKAVDAAEAVRELRPGVQRAVLRSLPDERLADVLEELAHSDSANLLVGLDIERAADVLDAMEPDDAADVVGELPAARAAALLERMEPEEAEDVRRLLTYEQRTAGGMMTTEPIILPPEATVADMLASASQSELPPALASIAFVCRPPLETPTGRFLGAVHIQRALREPPAALVGTVLDRNTGHVVPSDKIGAVTKTLATYNLTAIPVLIDGSLVGAISVDDVLDHLLPEDWRSVDDDTVEEEWEVSQ